MTTNADIIELLRDVSSKLDGVVDRVARLETAVAVDVAVTGRTLDRIAGIETTLADDIKPQTDDFKRFKLVGVGLVGILALGGFTVFGTIMWAGELATNAVRHWLRIP